MKKLSEILIDLIQIDTSNPPGREKEIANYLYSIFQGYRNIREIKHTEDRSSIIIDIDGSSQERIAFIGHIDTVPVTNLEDWTYHPFKGERVGDLIYGRGASDMKSGIACMISMGLYFINNKIIPKRSIRLIFTADEESSGMGIKAVVEEGLLSDVDKIIVPENTDEHLVLKEKGALWLEFKIYGKSAHGARPDLGINSIEMFYKLTKTIEDYISQFSPDSMLGENSISINKIEGGEKTNIIPDYCRGELDIRTNPNLKSKDILAFIDNEIHTLEGQFRNLKIKYDILNDRPSLYMDESHEFVLAFKNIVREVKGQVKIKAIRYFTDLSISHPLVSKPFIIYGPGFEEDGHQTNEKASILAMEKTSEVFIKLCME